jgi:hypothetical protein
MGRVGPGDRAAQTARQLRRRMASRRVGELRRAGAWRRLRGKQFPPPPTDTSEAWRGVSEKKGAMLREMTQRLAKSEDKAAALRTHVIEAIEEAKVSEVARAQALARATAAEMSLIRLKKAQQALCDMFDVIR